MTTGELVVITDNLRRRNVYFALALACFAIAASTLLFEFSGGIQFLWREAPIVGAVIAAAGVFFAVCWWRTPKT